ncbi:hypothetical protein ACOME3_001845 [Neoechinorhynchus agilis]
MKMMRKLFCLKQNHSNKRTIQNSENINKTKKLKGFRMIFQTVLKCFGGSKLEANGKDLENDHEKHTEQLMKKVNRPKIDVYTNNEENKTQNTKKWQDYQEDWAKIVDDVINADKNKIFNIPLLKEKEEVSRMPNIENEDRATFKGHHKKLKEPNTAKIRTTTTLTTKSKEPEDYSDGDDRCIRWIIWTAIFIMLMCAIVVGSTFGKCY